MKKKKVILGIILLLIVSLIIFIILNSKNNKFNGNKFYLDNDYYKNGEFIDIKVNDLEKLLDNKKTFILFSYNNYCNLPIPCNDIFEEVIKENNITMLKITFEDFKKTSLYKKIKLAPSVIIIKDGKIIDYLKADKDDDLKKYQDVKEFNSWLNKYIITKK